MTKRTPKPALSPNTIEFETQALVKPTGFREYDARWYFGLPGDEKPSELNLYGVQALGEGLGTLMHERGVPPKIAVGHDFRHYSLGIKQALMLGLVNAGVEVLDIGLALSPTAYFASPSRPPPISRNSIWIALASPWLRLRIIRMAGQA